MAITVGSVCSGYGGLEQALTLAGIDHTLEWVSEIDPGACKILDTRFPNVPNIGDINDSTPGPVDILTAGFPCQDISNAGQRKGLDGDRSGLWWTIRDAIGELRPGHVILENVAAILTRGGPAVIGSLTDLGYDCRWETLRASDIGAPHRRERWFCVASNPNGFGFERAGGTRRRGFRPSNNSPFTPDADSVGLERRVDGSRTQEQPTSERRPIGDASVSGRSEEYGKFGPAIRRWETIMGRTAPAPTVDNRLNPVFVEWMMGLPAGWVTDVNISRASQLRCLGNGIVPQQAATAIRNLGVR